MSRFKKVADKTPPAPLENLMIINIAKIVTCDTSRLLATDTANLENTRACCFLAKKLLAGLVYDMSSLEDNPFTFPEVQTLLEGITAGGHKLSDQQQVLNLSSSWEYLIQAVLKGTFTINIDFFCGLHHLVAQEEALTWGKFRNSQVYISGTEYKPPLFSMLDKLFISLVKDLEALENPVYKAMLFFLAGSRAQFFHDGNKRTSRLMMNGILMAHGVDAILIPNKKHLEFNQTMLVFYDSGEGADMINFLLNCRHSIEKSSYI